MLQKTFKLFLLSILTVGILTVAVVSNQMVQAQTSQKVFVFGKDLLDKIDTYTTILGEPVSISTNLPSVTVENWGSLSATSQSQIDNYATTHGWVSVTP